MLTPEIEEYRNLLAEANYDIMPAVRAAFSRCLDEIERLQRENAEQDGEIQLLKIRLFEEQDVHGHTTKERGELKAALRHIQLWLASDKRLATTQTMRDIAALLDKEPTA